jgi:hypothetical protein
MDELRALLYRFTAVVATLVWAMLLTRTAEAQVTIEYLQGTAFNVPTTLTIAQAGYPTISHSADYSTRPFDDRWYYDARVGYWKDDDNGWLVEFLHHKVYLDNPPQEVESFEVTHGYNMVTLNRAWRRRKLTFQAGGGAVVAHSNSLVRGKERSIREPYTLAGPTAQGAVGRSVAFTKWLFGSVEGKLTASWIRVPIADGQATVPNVAFHVLAGVGTRF